MLRQLACHSAHRKLELVRCRAMADCDFLMVDARVTSPRGQRTIES